MVAHTRNEFEAVLFSLAPVATDHGHCTSVDMPKWSQALNVRDSSERRLPRSPIRSGPVEVC